MSKHIAWHRPTVDDTRRTYDLIARCDTADYGEPDTYLEDLQSDWSRIDLERDAWLALAPADEPSAGDLLAYGAVSIYRQELEIHLYLDPCYQGLDLAAALLARCEARGREIAAEQGRALAARTYVAHSNQRLAEIVTGAGFELANIHFQMEVRLFPAHRGQDPFACVHHVPPCSFPIVLAYSSCWRTGRKPTCS